MQQRALVLIGLFLLAVPSTPSAQHKAPAAGVFIAHHPDGLEFSAGTDYCRDYRERFAIDDCTWQHPRIDPEYAGQGAVWFVLVAFADSTAWGGTEFGLGDYRAESFVFVDYGPCFPEDGLEISSAGWPGPQQGTAFVAAGEPWQGSIQPVYSFAGYAYAADLMPLGVDPMKGFGGTCTLNMVMRPAETFGSLGLFRDGVAVYPLAPPVQVVGPFDRDPRASAPGRLRRAAARVSDPPAGEVSLRISGNPGPRPRIDFTLPNRADVSLRLFDAGGRLVCTLLESALDRGAHGLVLGEMTSNRTHIANGIYAVRLEVDGAARARAALIVIR